MFGFLKKAFEGFTKALSKSEKPKTEKKEEQKPKELVKLEEREKKKGIFEELARVITETKISEEYFNKIFNSLETELLQNNVAVEVTDKLRAELKLDLVGQSLKRGELADKIHKDLHELLLDIFQAPAPIDLVKMTKEHKPLILLFVGVNGVGKTTTLAKVADWLQKQGLKCVFAASDTFRAASIEQLQAHAEKLGVELIKHDYGADPAAVAFDAIKHAKAKSIDVVLIDTAGRQHANVDLMAELQKIKRVTKPQLTVLTVDSLTGNDAVEQARLFNEKIGIDASILSKVDADEKGGALLSVAYTTKKPILFLGMGQRYEDLEKFEPDKIVSRILG
jgi:fused signal recognition particle receptor